MNTPSRAVNLPPFKLVPDLPPIEPADLPAPVLSTPQPVVPAASACLAPVRPGPVPLSDAAILNMIAKILRSPQDRQVLCASPDGVGKMDEDADYNPFDVENVPSNP